MKKKYRLKDLAELVSHQLDDEEPVNDITVTYMVSKLSEKSVDTKLLVSCVTVYVQNSPVYFATDTGMGFVHDVFVFSITGEVNDHTNLINVLGGDLEKINCKLERFS